MVSYSKSANLGANFCSVRRFWCRVWPLECRFLSGGANSANPHQTLDLEMHAEKIAILTCKTQAGWWWLEHEVYCSIYWECHHLNWLIFFRGVETTNQYVCVTRLYVKELCVCVTNMCMCVCIFMTKNNQNSTQWCGQKTTRTWNEKYWYKASEIGLQYALRVSVSIEIVVDHLILVNRLLFFSNPMEISGC